MGTSPGAAMKLRMTRTRCWRASPATDSGICSARSAASMRGRGNLTAAIRGHRQEHVPGRARQRSGGELAGRAVETLDHDEAADLAVVEVVQERLVILQRHAAVGLAVGAEHER